MRYTAGNFNENPSMRALAKFLRARTREHSSNFCEQSEKKPNFASAFKLDGTILYPYFASTFNYTRSSSEHGPVSVSKVPVKKVTVKPLLRDIL